MRLHGEFASEYVEKDAASLNSPGKVRYYMAIIEEGGEQLGLKMVDLECKVTVIGATMRPDHASDRIYRGRDEGASPH